MERTTLAFCTPRHGALLCTGSSIGRAPYFLLRGAGSRRVQCSACFRCFSNMWRGVPEKACRRGRAPPASGPHDPGRGMWRRTGGAGCHRSGDADAHGPGATPERLRFPEGLAKPGQSHCGKLYNSSAVSLIAVAPRQMSADISNRPLEDVSKRESRISPR
jgi:hypothetical protein